MRNHNHEEPREEKGVWKLKKIDSRNKSSQHLFKMEEKVEIKHYEGKVDSLKWSHWL